MFLSKHIPTTLKAMFIANSIIDILIGLPLLIMPIKFLSLLEIISMDQTTPRMAGAAFLGLGIVTLIEHHKSPEYYDTFLTLRIVWTICMIFGVIMAIVLSGEAFLYIFLCVLVVLLFAWVFFKHYINK